MDNNTEKIHIIQCRDTGLFYHSVDGWVDVAAASKMTYNEAAACVRELLEQGEDVLGLVLS